MITYTYKFILRKDRVLLDGTYPILLQAFLGGQRVRIRMDLYLKAPEWDAVRQCARIPKDREKESRINSILTKYRSRVEDLLFDARKSGVPLTPKIFTEEIDNKPAMESLISFIEKEIESERADKEASTVKHYGTLVMHLKEFQPAAAYADVSFDFVQDFDRFMKKKGLSQNSRAKYHTLLRKFVLLAIRRRKRIVNPYLHDFKIVTTETNRTWLNVEEVDSLITLYKSGSLGWPLQRVLRQFLFQVFASVRVSDVKLLTKGDVQGDLLVLVPQKTKRLRKAVTIPLSNFTKQLIADGGGKGEYLFSTVADQTVNEKLKEISLIAGIKKHITTHVGRHTFGFLYLLMGGKVEELKEIMGHADMKTTMIYTHTDYDRKVAGVRKFDEIFKVNG